jgi:tRNA1(Val) A37 N6-methylase TrmN6
LWPGKGEDLCHLSGDWRILQRVRGHRWSLDDLVTAWVAAEVGQRSPAPPQRIADLGCGIGAVLLLLAWRFPEARVVGIEAQAESAALARRSIAWNGVEERCKVLTGDLRSAVSVCDEECFDLITGTPPYLPPGSGREPTRSLQAACHIEHRGGIEDYCASAVRWLRPGGRFVACHSSRERTAQAASHAGLVIEAELSVIPRAGKAPLFSAFTMATRVVEQPTRGTLVVRATDGQWSDDFRALRRAMGMPDR